MSALSLAMLLLIAVEKASPCSGAEVRACGRLPDAGLGVCLTSLATSSRIDGKGGLLPNLAVICFARMACVCSAYRALSSR